MQKDAALVSPGFWRGVSGCGNRGEFRVSCLRVMGGAGGAGLEDPNSSFRVRGPRAVCAHLVSGFGNAKRSG